MPAQPALDRRTTATLVADALRRRILRGEVAEGTQLRQEAVAAEFGVSRIPVREALRQLDAEGFVTLVSHKGAVVSQVSTDEVMEIFDIRVVLETWLLGLAIPQMTDADLDAAEAALGRMVATADRIAEWGILNWQFHAGLYRPARHRETLRILERLHVTADRYIRLQICLTEGQAQAHAEHRAILDACRRRDGPTAQRLLADHIRAVKTVLLERLATP